MVNKIVITAILLCTQPGSEMHHSDKLTETAVECLQLIYGTKGDMFGITLVTMALHELTKLFENKAEDEHDKLPPPSSIHMPNEIEAESFPFPPLPPYPRPKFLLRHRRRRARNRAYVKALIKSLPVDMQF